MWWATLGWTLACIYTIALLFLRVGNFETNLQPEGLVEIVFEIVLKSNTGHIKSFNSTHLPCCLDQETTSDFLQLQLALPLKR